VKEMEERPFRILVMQTRYGEVPGYVFMLFEDQKLLSGED